MPNEYQNYEAYFRGSESSLAGRKAELQPLVEYVKNIFVDDIPTSWLDIGAGAGLLVDIAKEQGFTTSAIESDGSLANTCESKSHYTINSDQEAALASLVDQGEKYHVISALHVIEHLDPIEAYGLISNCVRLLEDGGVLVLETPNALDSRVMVGSFYRDPTHVRPYPRRLLEFIASDHNLEIIASDNFDKQLGDSTQGTDLLRRVKRIQQRLNKLTLKTQ